MKNYQAVHNLTNMTDYNPNTPEAIKALANNIVPIAEVPTSANSKRQSDSSAIPAGMDSPANVGNLSC